MTKRWRGDLAARKSLAVQQGGRRTGFRWQINL